MFRLVENNVFNLLLIVVIIFAGLFVISFLINYVTKLIPYIRASMKLLFDYSYVVLLGVGLLYLVSYHSSSINGVLQDGFYFKKDLADALEKLSYLLFSVGAFSATLKYISSMSIFKKQFKNMIISDNFKAFAYSEEHLKKQDNIKEIWKTVTLCKYRSSFPLIYDKLEENLDNELFIKANTSFYYKHFDVIYNLSLVDGKYVHIEYITNYTIVRNTTNKFIWTFSTTMLKKEYESKNNPFKVEVFGENGMIFDKSNLEPVLNNDKVTLNFTKELEGKTEYHIKKTKYSRLNIDEDRMLGFGSSRIIDDLKVTIKYCSKLKIVFSTVNKNQFSVNIDESNRIHEYENRELILPGEKFKIFLIRDN